jgi:hypothetical protein
MTFSAPYAIPDIPPAEVLAELDAAAHALDELRARAEQLTIAMDGHARQLRIEHVVDGSLRRLRPSQLFDLLGGTSHS